METSNVMYINKKSVDKNRLIIHGFILFYFFLLSIHCLASIPLGSLPNESIRTIWLASLTL